MGFDYNELRSVIYGPIGVRIMLSNHATLLMNKADGRINSGDCPELRLFGS